MLKSLRKEYLEDPYSDEYTKHEIDEDSFQVWKKQYKEERDRKKLWKQIGFHRPLGGFWHNFVLQILIIMLPAIWVGYFLKNLYPFPEMKGYADAYSGIFIVIFTIFDLGTNATIGRFIADENIKNPNEMVKYIQYFIWYQSITGLMQMTFIGYWAINYASQTELAIGIYIMLAVSTKQWPGFLGVFKGLLNSLQLYSKNL